MSVVPNTTVSTIDAPPAAPSTLDSTRLILAMESLRGTREPMRFRSARDVSRQLERSGVGIPAYDAVDVALRAGVPEVWLARILGPAAASAHLDLAGPTSGVSVTLTLNEPGEWGNGAAGGVTGEVVAVATTSRQVILRRGSTVLAVSPVAATRADLLAWNATQSIVTVSLGSNTGLPVVAAVANFAGGASDSGSITDAHARAALDSVPLDKAPSGQVATPGRNTVGANTVLLQHGQAFNRTALLEIADGLDAAGITTESLTLRALGSGAEGLPRLGGAWAQFATGPSIVPGQTRTVPWTIIVAGLIATLERQEGHPNVSPFGDFGVSAWATGVTRYFTAADADTLLSAGVNVVTSYLDVPRNASFRTLEADGASEWVDLAHTRLDRAIRAEAADVGRKMGARLINRSTVNDFGGKLRLRLANYWRAGATFGDTPDQAARVETDSTNDTASMAAREVNADVGVRMSEHAEYVNVTIAKVPIGQEV